MALRSIKRRLLEEEIEATGHVRTDEPAEGIADFAAREATDLIVMCTSGKGH